jgi:hypothetical protein
MAVNINIPSEVTQTITDGVTTTAPSENAVHDALSLKANTADLADVATTGDYDDLINQPSIPAAQVNSDWNATSGVAEILNKPTLSSGTVTSVGLTMPTAFSVANSPVTGAGTLAVTAAGVASQYIRGDGQLANFPTSSGGGSSVNFYLNGSVAQGTLGGVAFKQMSSTPVIGTGTDFSINADGYIQSFITDASVPNQLSIPSGNWNFEMYFSASSNGGSPRFYLELYKLSGGTLTLLASSSATPEYITNGIAIDLYTTALSVPSTVLLAADRLAVRVYVIHSSKTITLHTENSHLCQVITTFSTGLTALNGLTTQVQNLAVGTSGTDFAISSATNTHTFNLPTASAANRGALSTSDWSAFNGKQAALVSGTNIKTINGTSVLGAGDLVISGGGGITVGTTAVTSGTVGRVFFQATGDVVQQSANLFWDNANGRLNLGAVGTNSARLDIKAPGALSTDIAFRVRNSADSATILQVNGVGQVWANGKGFIASNTCFGELALNANTTGANNTAFGYRAGNATTTGGQQTAIGWGSLELTTGAGNTAVGFAAGQLITTGTYNTCIGYAAGSNGAPTYGVYVGYTTGATSTGQNVVAIGNVAAQGLTTGSGGIAIGNSVRIGTTGSHNISLGQSAGIGLTTGSFNIHLGYRNAGSGVITGNYNTLIGGDSVIGDVSSNAVLSDGAGNQAIRKDANHNVLLGREVALATNATNGFAYLPTCAGVPTGVPAASFTGKAPVVIDSTNNKMYIYTNAAWVALN